MKKLQHEMNTQDHVGQADPRYWVIRDYNKVYGESLNNADGVSIYDCNRCNTILEMEYQYFDIDKVINEILKVFDDEEYELEADTVENIKSAYDISSLIDALRDIEEYELSVSEYQEIPVDKGMFLTHEAAIQHLKNNEHHYSANAHTYAMTAWRSSEEKLWNILQTVDFDQLN